MWRSIFVFAALTIGALSAAAQTGTLTGIVSDAITGEALIQATVRIGNTGVATDFDGKYAVSLPYGSHEITVQYIGYESKTRTIESQPAIGAIQLQVEHDCIARSSGSRRCCDRA